MQPGSSPLDQLADIHLPDSVSWWPLALGWWLLICLFLVLLVLLILWRKRIIKRRYRQHALELLHAAYKQYETDKKSAVYLQQLSQLLRRVARTSYGSLFEPNLKGDAWLHWLDSSCPALKQNFATGPGRLLLSGPYQKNPQDELEPLHQLSLEWIRQHNTHKSVLKKLHTEKNHNTNNPTNTINTTNTINSTEVSQHV